MKSPDERYKYTKTAHGNLSDTFQHSQRSFFFNQNRIKLCEQSVTVGGFYPYHITCRRGRLRYLYGEDTFPDSQVGH